MKSGSGERVYKNVFEVFVKTWRNEGLRGVQRGLGPAVRRPPLHFRDLAFCKLLGQYFYQVALNGSRLGLYEPFRRWANTQLGYSPTQQVVLTSMGAGSVSAVVGCASSCHFLAMCSLIFLSILGQPALPRQDTHASVLSSTSCRCTTILSAWVGRAANYRPRRGCQGLASGLGRCDSAGGDRGLGMCVVFAFFEC